VTKQISDSLLFKGETYTLLWCIPLYTHLFEFFSVELRPLSTANYRGWHCTYHVDDKLWLSEIEVGLFGANEAKAKEGRAPRLFGVLPEPHYYERKRRDLWTGKTVSDLAPMGTWVYRPRQLMTKVKTVGISKAPLEEAFTDGWVYRIPVYELRFDSGTLTEVIDLTDPYYLHHLHQDAALKRAISDQRDKMLREWAKEAQEKHKAKRWRRFLFWKK
jgi:hypothetical protein